MLELFTKETPKDLSDLKKSIDQYMNGFNPYDTTRLRDKILIDKIYYMIAYDMGYTYKTIGKDLKKCYSTVIHHVRDGYDLLEVDKEFREMYIKISSSINPKIYPHARINKITLEESSNCKSAGTSRMHTREYKVTRPNHRLGGKSKTTEKRSIFN